MIAMIEWSLILGSSLAAFICGLILGIIVGYIVWTEPDE